MLKYDQLLGKPFKHGTQDCLSLVRGFYFDNFGIEIPDYARPDDWWENGLNFYMDLYEENGFELLHVHPVDLRPGDMIYMQIKSPVPNHAAILVEDGEIIHHFLGQLSRKVAYRGIWRNSTVAFLRHKSLKDWQPEEEKLDLVDLLPLQRRMKLGLECKTSSSEPQSDAGSSSETEALSSATTSATSPKRASRSKPKTS